MIPEWLLGVAAAGGSAFVGAAATDAWETARAGAVALFGRGGQRRTELVTRWADETAAEIEQTVEEQRLHVRERLAPIWQQRLADLVEEYPEVGEELRVWVQQLQERLPRPQQNWVNTFIARDKSQQYNAPGGSITLNASPGTARPSS
ncbi:hypothetical protein ACFT9M_03815 [Micromonospora purpureochromogenes]|uniref:hypothetical protein n=1 Tax=Micromonospora purpureochromogenes TaxID=47872 RepID=UPI00363CB1F8